MSKLPGLSQLQQGTAGHVLGVYLRLMLSFVYTLRLLVGVELGQPLHYSQCNSTVILSFQFSEGKGSSALSLLFAS